MSERYHQAVRYLSGQALDLLTQLPATIAENVREVRLRTGRPICLYNGEMLFLGRNGQTFRTHSRSLPILSQRTLEECFHSLCEYSVHTHLQDIAQGFVTLNGGHRAGIAGNCVFEQEKAVGLRDVSSICLRIAREAHGCAAPLIEILGNTSNGLLIAGAPGSGKTTLLRDLTRSLSSGENGTYHNIAVVDERGEIAAVSNGRPQLDVGVCSDILTGYSKGTGIGIAVRTLAPEFIVCDELGGTEDLEIFRHSVSCGVRMIATIHARDERELLAKAGIRALLETGVFSGIVFLGDSSSPGKIGRFVSLSEEGIP